ncbi:MAG TPA: ABC transporter permease [Steroidobacteraceae bacterium]|nr:ABC transporter permease [Steroidobacteraceae bacterium]
MNANTLADTLATPAEPVDALRPLRILLKETQYELAGRMRTRAYSLSVIGLPVMFYLLFGLANRGKPGALYLIAGYACWGVVSACLFGIGLALALERAQGWLDLKRASPMPRFAYVGAKIASCAAFGLIITIVLILLGGSLGGVTVTGGQAVALMGVAIAGSIPFAAMGFFVAYLVPPNSGPGIINLIYLPLSFASGFWMPVSMLPHWLQVVAPALPTYHLAQIALAAVGMAPAGGMALHWAVLGGFTVLMLGAAWITFLRSEANA